MTRPFDVIVLGLGGLGSAVAAQPAHGGISAPARTSAANWRLRTDETLTQTVERRSLRSL